MGTRTLGPTQRVTAASELQLVSSSRVRGQSEKEGQVLLRREREPLAS